MIKKYRKKPVVIEAVQWTGYRPRVMFDFLTGTEGLPMQTDGKTFEIDHNKVQGGLIIKTLEGKMLANYGDYIIKGVEGEFYPCKPDIFHKTYEEVPQSELEAEIACYGAIREV